ncbi:MAG: S9 family peptidase [Acidobacteria bacterium]|nr:S9 family peptidase [Acidobacteriota bacterium]
MSSLRHIAVLLVCAAGATAATAPITHEALWLMKRVGAPVPSPDGKWVIVPVTEPAYDEKEQVSDLWIVPSDASAKPRRLTAGKGSESGVAWSPDSRRIAFSARREGDEASQIYVLDVVAGGEAQRVTSASGGATAPRFSPDGSVLLFTSSVDAGAAERKARKYSARVYDGFPVRFWDHWLEEARPHLFVQKAEAGAEARDLLAGSKLAASKGFAGTETASGEELAAAWAPDGKSVVFACSVNREEAAFAEVRTHLFEVREDGGEPRQITSGKDSFSQPRFRPDGKALYMLHSAGGDGQVYHVSRLAIMVWPAAGEPKVLTGGFDRSVGSFAFTPDSRTLYLLAEEAGHEKLFSMPAAGGGVKLAFDMKLGVYTGMTIPEKAELLVANWESSVNPAEVVRIDPRAGAHKPLSEFNTARAAQIDWQAPRHFWFTSGRGKRIHNMLILPPSFDPAKKYPLVAMIHGGPHSMWRDQFFLRWNYHLLTTPGYVLLLTDYTGSTGYGEKFAQEIQGDPLKGPGEEIDQAVNQALKEFPFLDGAKMCAGGASYGGHMANWLQATTTRYRCLFSHAGLINLESQWGTSDTIFHREISNGGPVWEQGPVWREQNPIRYAKNFRTPMLLTVGEKDFRVPLNQTLENWSVLKRLQIPSRLIVFPDANHWILKGEDSRFFYGELLGWLKRYLN